MRSISPDASTRFSSTTRPPDSADDEALNDGACPVHHARTIMDLTVTRVLEGSQLALGSRRPTFRRRSSTPPQKIAARRYIVLQTIFRQPDQRVTRSLPATCKSEAVEADRTRFIMLSPPAITLDGRSAAGSPMTWRSTSGPPDQLQRTCGRQHPIDFYVRAAAGNLD